MFPRKHVLRAEADDGAGDGAGGAGGEVDATLDSGTDDGGSTELDTQLDSLFAMGADGGDGAGGGDAVTIDPDTGRPSDVPEKFWDVEKKALNQDAMLKSYKHAWSRLSAADRELVPTAAADYKLDLAEGEDLGIDVDNLSPFNDFALKEELSNKQYNSVLREIVANARAALDGSRQAQRTRTYDALKAEFGNDKAVKAEINASYQGLVSLSTPEEIELIKTLPDHPFLVKLMARLGRQVREDTPPGGERPAAFEQQTAEALAIRKGVAFFNDRNPGHAAAKAKVAAWEDECIRRGVSSTELTQRRA